MKKIKAVFFDLDGTLADTEPYHRQSRDNILNTYGIKDNESRLSVGISIYKLWDKIAEANKLDCSGKYLAELNLSGVFELIKENKVEANDRVGELLKVLKNNNIVTAVVSSSGRSYVENVLKYLNIFDYFDFLVCGDEVENLKPHPEIYLKALTLSGVKADEAIAVEDSDVGILSAKSAGIYCLGYNSLKAEVKQSFKDCDKQIGNLTEIEKLFI